MRRASREARSPVGRLLLLLGIPVVALAAAWWLLRPAEQVSQQQLVAEASAALDALPMNQLQYLGTHNSYHIQPPKELFDLLLAVIPKIAPTLEYSHVPLSDEEGTREVISKVIGGL